MEVGWDNLRLKTYDAVSSSLFENLPTLGLGIDTSEKINEKEWLFKAQPDYRGGHYDHFCNFFDSVRTGKLNKANLLFGLQSAAPAVLSNYSLKQGTPIHWNPLQLRLTKK